MGEQFQAFLDKAKIEFDKDLELKTTGLLTARGKTLSVAESLTGGLLAERLTSLAGSSKFFIGGVVCYHVRAKVVMTGIEPAIIAKHGVVSAETAAGLARGIRQRLKTDLSLAVTGVAGPEPHDGKPVGMVYIALADDEKELVKHFMFDGSREKIRGLTVLAAFKMLEIYFENNKVKK